MKLSDHVYFTMTVALLADTFALNYVAIFTLTMIKRFLLSYVKFNF